MIALLLLACARAPSAGVDTGACPVDAPGLGADPAVVEACTTCHTDVGATWAQAGSHGILFDCAGCHRVLAASGEDHAEEPACSDCHSAAAHHADCDDCHAPHGSGNLYLLAPTWSLPQGGVGAVVLSVPRGASPGGLVDGGAGPCELCHTTTRHYRADGAGSAHETGWCPACHSHEDAFQPAY